MARTTIRTEDITASEVTTAKMAVDPTNASNLSSGSVPEAQLGNVPPNTGLQNDIATLALHSAIADNKAAFNLTNAFIDQYEDSSGIDTTTDTSRNAGEYMSSYSDAGPFGGIDANTKLMLHCDGANDGTTFTDSSSAGLAVTAVGDAHTDTAIKKFGTASYQGDGTGDCLTVSTSLPAFGTTDFTIDMWVYFDSIAARMDFYSRGTTGGDNYYFACHPHYGTPTMDFYSPGGTVMNISSTGTTFAVDTWYHIAMVRGSGYAKFYVNGVQQTNSVESNPNKDMTTTSAPNIGRDSASSGYIWNGHLDEIRISNTARWTSGFTPPTVPYNAAGTVATGNYTSTTETANATVSKMGVVVLYKNESGTATLDTDLIVQVSADGGSNYVSAPLTSAGTFSTGILSAKSNDITISNTGTAPKYKVSFANQSTGVKETQVHGIALLY